MLLDSVLSEDKVQDTVDKVSAVDQVLAPQDSVGQVLVEQAMVDKVDPVLVDLVSVDLVDSVAGLLADLVLEVDLPWAVPQAVLAFLVVLAVSATDA